MLAQPWKTVAAADPDAECVVMATYLPLRSYRSIPGFLRWTFRIQRQLHASDGLLGYALATQLLRKRFWTVSAWTDERSLGRFNRSDPHRRAMDAIRPRMGRTVFVSWTVTASDVPVGWADVQRRVEDATPES